eukprot:7057950-Alexandrium_andersonii.AAC.1
MVLVAKTTEGLRILGGAKGHNPSFRENRPNQDGDDLLMGRGTLGEDLKGLALPGGAHGAHHRRVSADGGVLPSLP